MNRLPLWFVLVVVGCDSGGGDGGGGCVEGGTTACDCEDGARGVRVCGADGEARCACDGGVVETDGGVGADGDVGCVPDCVGRACGADGCGATCGSCAAAEVCDQAGQCAAPPAACGDGACGDDEDCGTCPADCGACCGDGHCARGEDCATCAADCACAMGRVCSAGACEVRACEGADCGAPPRILTFNVNTRRLTDGEQITFSAVVTDPDGVADLVGGLLEDAGGAAYGAFVAAGEAGAYQMALGWDAIHAVRPIEFEGEATRDFVAVFFDQAGNRVTETLQIALHCDAAGGVACAGRCTDLNEARHCGACRAACDGVCRDRQCACADGLMRCGGGCVDTGADAAHCGGCDRACPGAEGGAPVCVDGGCGDPCLASARTTCGGACVDTDADPAHCGDCGHACEAPAGGTATCGGGECGVRCAAGRAMCGGQCAECPGEPATEVACAGDRCVAVACEDGARLCDGACTVCPSEGVAQADCVGRRCLATACREGFHVCAEGCCPWRFGDVAPAASFALALDGAGRPHVVLGTRERVRLARLDPASGEWDAAEVAPLAPEVAFAPDVALAFAGETPYVAYSWFTPAPPEGVSAGELRFVRRDGAGWAELGSRRDSGLDLPRGPTLATDDRGAVHGCYENNRLWCGPLVDFAPVQVTDVRAQAPHLVFDGAVPHVTWRNFAGGAVGHATRGDAWQVAIADHARASQPPRLAVTAEGPVLVHANEANELAWTRRVANVWRTERVLADAIFGADFDVAADAAGAPVVCVGTARGLLLLRRDGARWREAPVERQATSRCRIAVSPEGAIHLVYVDVGRNVIRAAR